MKKILILLWFALWLFLSFFLTQSAFAGPDCDWNDCVWASPTQWGADGPKTIKLTTTELVPWANCTLTTEEGDINKKYECEVPLGWKPVMIMMGKMIRFLTTVAIIGAVLFMVISGIQLSMGWLDGNAKSAAKDRIFKLLGWVILLLLSWPLLTLIAPWVFR